MATKLEGGGEGLSGLLLEFFLRLPKADIPEHLTFDIKLDLMRCNENEIYCLQFE